jgi:hypothetical protein
MIRCYAFLQHLKTIFENMFLPFAKQCKQNVFFNKAFVLIVMHLFLSLKKKFCLIERTFLSFLKQLLSCVAAHPDFRAQCYKSFRRLFRRLTPIT